MQSIRPTLGEDSINSTLNNCIRNTAGHCFRVWNHNAAETYVHYFLASLTSGVNERKEVLRRSPLLCPEVSIVEEPIT